MRPILALLLALIAAPALAQIAGGGGTGGGGGGVVHTADAQATGTLNLATQDAAYTVTGGAGQNTAWFSVGGITGTGAFLALEQSFDGTAWLPALGYSQDDLVYNAISGDGWFTIPIAGRKQLRLRIAGTGIGTLTVASITTTAVPDNQTAGADHIPSGVNAAVSAPGTYASTTPIFGNHYWIVTFTGLTAKGATLTPQANYNVAGTWVNEAAYSIDGTIRYTTITADGTYVLPISGRTMERIQITGAGSAGNVVMFQITTGSVIAALSTNYYLHSLGLPDDAVCSTAAGTCSVEALLKYRNSNGATAANQTTANASLATIAGGIGGMATLPAFAATPTFNLGTLNGASTAANQTTANTSLATIAGNTAIPYPSGATPVTASVTGTTGATTATLAASGSLHTYICGFSIRANATAAATANSTVTGTVTATMNFTQWTAPNSSGIGITEEIFSPCVPSSAINTGIAVISAAPGTGGVVSVTAWGFQGPT